MSAKASIYLMIIPSDKIFAWVPPFLPCALVLGVWPTFENVNLVNNFSTVSV